eukprot:scaffold131300_cov63-Phaeocystis_antarctica.AAC.2
MSVWTRSNALAVPPSTSLRLMPGDSKDRFSGYFLSISCARLPAPEFSGDMISTVGGKLSFCFVTSPDTYKSAPSVCRSGSLPTEPLRARFVVPYGAFAPARSCRLESDREAPMPAASETLPPALLGGSHHPPLEAKSCCTRVVGGGSGGGGDGGGDGLRNRSIHRLSPDSQRSKSACLECTLYPGCTYELWELRLSMAHAW